jgi:hypothetical protein
MTGEGEGEGMTLEQMMKQHPEATQVDLDALVECIETCSTCEAACVSCADACLSEESVQELVDCIRLNLDCADLCGVTVRFLSRHSRREPRMLQDALLACIVACIACAEECQRHADHHEHCAVCAEEWSARRNAAAAPNRANLRALLPHDSNFTLRSES